MFFKVIAGRKRIRILHEAMKVIEGSLQERELRLFAIYTREHVERKCILLRVSHYCDISVGKDISGVQYSVAVKSAYFRCNMTREDIISGQTTHGRSLSETTIVKNESSKNS